jgi:hypothetical protein
MMAAAWISSSVYRPQGRQVAMPFDYMEQHIRHPKPAATKDSLARWALVEFRESYRCNANFLRGHGITFDVDDGTTIDQLRVAFAGLYVVIHSTFGASAEAPRWRVIVLLDRPVESVEEHDRVWRWLAMKLEAVGGRPEYGARDAAHAWAVPAIPPTGYYEAHVLEGAFASVGEALSFIPKPEPLPEIAHYRGEETYERRMDRASKYLASMDAALSGSGGHAATLRAAVALVRGFALTKADSLSLLEMEFNRRCQPEWSRYDLKHKIESAYLRGRMPFGALATAKKAGGA